MPPKKEQPKKGQASKPTIAPKDIVPVSVREPPRESRPTKPLDNFPDPEFKNEFEPLHVLECWPGNQEAKAYDFGTELYSDPLNHLVASFFEDKSVAKWKPMRVIQKLQSYQIEEECEDDASVHSIQSQNDMAYCEEDDAIDQPQQVQSAKEMVMIDTFMRDQTTEQADKRKKDQLEKAAKDKKKATKKDDPKDQNALLKVKDVALGNVQIHSYMLRESRWIGTHLQLVKDRDLRDVYTQQPIWKKIYPQIDGVPVISKSGKYWVKLYHMGKEVKIEVDSQLPIDNKCRYMFPLSRKHHQKWPLIVCKALIKLVAINNAPEKICGDGLTLYALTGLVCQNLLLKGFKDWTRLGNYLSDAHYVKKDIVATCWSSQSFQSTAPSNTIKAPNDYSKLFQSGNSSFKPKPAAKRFQRSNSGVLPRYEDYEEDKKETRIQTGIQQDHCYWISDYLHNGELSMASVQNRSAKEMRLRQEYTELSKIPLSNKTKDQKLEHRKKKKQLKEKIAVEEQKRLEIMNRPNQPSYFLKISANIRVYCQYSVQQINIAKKCLLNGLTKPPNYEAYDPKEEAKAAVQASLPKGSEEKDKDQMAVKSLSDFSSLPDALDPLERAENGVWIQCEDFLRSFQYLQLYYDPTKLANQVIHRIPGQAGVQFTLDQTKEVLIVQKQEKDESTTLLFGFAPEYPKQAEHMGMPHSILQKFNFQDYVAISSSPPLHDPISCFRLQLQNQNHLYRVVTVARAGYCYWLSSNAPFKLMSILSYLTEYQNYSLKQFTTQFASVQAGKYNLYFRLQIKGGDTANIMFIKLKGIDSNVLKHLRYKLIKPCQANDINLLLEDGKYFQEKALIVDLHNKIEIEPNTKYFLLLEGILPFDFRGGSVDADIYSKSTLQVDLVENVQPLRYMEKYVANKYGLICRERLFTNADAVVTLLFQVVESENVIKEIDKKPKKAGKEDAQQYAETELKEKRTVRFELYCGDEMVAAKEGANVTLISNIEILSTKQEDRVYYLQALFNLHQWPQAKDPDSTSNIYWTLKVTSSESIAVVRDTTQEDKQILTKKQWEDVDPGRAERAKKSRKRYLLQQKLQRGQQLTEEQKQMVSQPRLSKKQILQEQKKQAEQKGKSKAPPKKDQKKGKKEEIKVVLQEDKPKQFPVSQQNIMTELNQFLKHFQSKRILDEEETTEHIVRASDNLSAIKEGSLLAQEDRVGLIVRNIQSRQFSKISQDEKKHSLQMFSSKAKEELKANWASYMSKRNSLFQQSKQKVQRDKAAISLLRGDRTLSTEAQIEKALREYETAQDHNVLLLEGLQMLWKNKKISILSDRLTAALPFYEMEQLVKVRTDIERDRVEGISHELIQQLEAIQGQFKNNPSSIAEKQAQLKKQKKGGKK